MVLSSDTFRKLVAISAFCFIVSPLSSASADSHRCFDVTPLPDDIPESLFSSPKSDAGTWTPGVYSGEWKTEKICQTFVVLSVDQDNAQVIYSYEGNEKYPSNFERHEAKATKGGKRLSFKTSWGAQISYDVDGRSTYRHNREYGVGVVSHLGSN